MTLFDREDTLHRTAVRTVQCFLGVLSVKASDCLSLSYPAISLPNDYSMAEKAGLIRYQTL